MYLKKFVIKNFRSFNEQGISLLFNKGINAIIGENNVGKSSVIDAIRIAFTTVMYKKDIYFTKADFHIKNSGETVDYAEFDIELEEVPKNLIEIWNPLSESKDGGEFHIRFERYISPNGLEKVRVKQWGIGTEGNPLTQDTFEAIDIAFLGALRDSENEMKPSKNSKLAQLLRNIVPDEETRNDLVGVLEDANNTLLKKEQLLRTKNTINSNLTNIEQELLRQQVDIGLVEPRFDSIASSIRAWIKPRWVLLEKSDEEYDKAEELMKMKPNSKFIQKTEDGIYFDMSLLDEKIEIEQSLENRIKEISNRSFELHQNGMGYNNLLFMSAVLGDMSIPKGGVYQNLLLVEEPEAHLHPQLQELVHNFFVDANNKSSNIQVIYTSHSPTLVSKIGIDNINLLYEDVHNKYCLPLSETKLEYDDKRYLEKYLDVTKSQMFFAKGIVFVEGISEALLLPEMAKLLERPFEKYSVEIINIDSVAFSPFVKLFSSDNVETKFRKIAVITDDDRCTQKGSDTYISKDIDYNEYSKVIFDNIQKGEASERFNELKKECEENNISIFGAKKTLEYALCCSQNNINIMLDVIKKEYINLGVELENKVSKLNEIEEKATCIWLFIRNRNKCKSAIAQRICKVIDQQLRDIKDNKAVTCKFDIPQYIKDAILCVTEK